MRTLRIILAIDGSSSMAPVYINKFEALKDDISDCLPLGKDIQNVDFRLIDINKIPKEAERFNIRSTPTLLIGNLKILGIGDLSDVVNIIKENLEKD
jgi:hypothetical protein